MNQLLRNLFIALALIFVFGACEKDNKPAPSAKLTGRVVYQDQAIGLRSNGVQLELWQHGYQLFTKIPIYVNQDGTFSASLFDGDYQLVRLKGNGPWVDNTDTIHVALRGRLELEVPVKPYHRFANVNFSQANKKVSSSFTVEKLDNSKSLERISLYIGTTVIVDPNNNIAAASIPASEVADLTKPLQLSVNVPTSFQGRDYVFARLAVKTSGVAEMLFSEPIKIMLN